MKFIHTSDWQLGMTRWFLIGDDNDGQARFSESRLAAVDAMGTIAVEEEAEFIIVAGDVFDSNTLESREVGRALERLRQLPVPVYLLPGNHDYYGAASIYQRDFFTQYNTDNASGGVVVLTPENSVITHEGKNGPVEIVGVAMTSREGDPEQFELTLQQLQPIDYPRIVVAHGQVDGFGHDAGASLSLTAVEEAVARGVVDYIAVGDSHSTRKLDAGGYMWFSGAHETTDFDDKEGDSGNILLVEIGGEESGQPPKVQSKKVGTWEFQAHTRDFADFEDVSGWLDQLEAMPHKDRTCVKYSLTGTVTLAQKAEVDRRLAALEPVFAALYQRRSGTELTVRPEDGDIAALGVSGFTLAAAHTLQQQSDNADLSVEQRRQATDALGLLARLVGGN